MGDESIETVAEATTEVPEIITRIYQEIIDNVSYLGLELPIDFFEQLNVKNNDTFTWDRVDDNTYTIKINRN